MAKLLQRYNTNTSGRDYVVGDIHGQFAALEALLEHIDFDRTRDRLFSVGDLIDRGPDSHRVTAFLNEPWFHAILGNHEAMLLESAYTVTALPDARANARLWRMNGGGWFLKRPLPEQKIIYTAIGRLPVAAEIELPDGRQAGLVHASVGQGEANERHWSRISATPDATFNAGEFDPINDLIWSRELAHAAIRRITTGAMVDTIVHGIDVVYFGHTPQNAPIRVDNTRWLDTGAGYGDQLSVAELSVWGRVWSMVITDRSVSEGWVTPAK